MGFLDPEADDPTPPEVVRALQRAAELSRRCTPEQYASLLELARSSTEDLRKRPLLKGEPFRLTE